MPRAVITGVTGQDRLNLGELLAAKAYEVYRLNRGQRNPKMATVEEIIPSIEPLEGDPRDLSNLISALEIAQPDEIYNPGAISFVGLSWKQAEFTGEITGLGVLRMLEAIRIHTQSDVGQARFYQASSSEMFGKVRETPRRETTALHHRSPYGVGKTFGHCVTVNSASHTAPSAARESCSTTRVLVVVTSSSPVRWPGPWRGFLSGCRTLARWATSTPAGTGASPTTSASTTGYRWSSRTRGSFGSPRSTGT